MRFLIDDDTLTIRFEGLEQFWALKRKFVIAKHDILQAKWDETLLLDRLELGLRWGGANVPGILYAGQFKGMDGFQLVYLEKPRRSQGKVAIKHVLSLMIQNSHYQVARFTVDDPDMAERIVAWWASH